MHYYRANHPDEVVEILRDLLADAGRTQRDLAEYLGFSEKHVSQIFTGRAGLTLPNLFAILDYVNSCPRTVAAGGVSLSFP